MNVKLIEATENPEELVCRAARNDYRKEGLIGHSFEEVMADVEPSDKHDPGSPIVGEPDSYPDDEEVLEAKKRTLLDKLIHDGHWGPFEHPQATVQIEGVTRVLMAQMTRHRHFTFDVLSLRYVGLDGKIDDVEEWFEIPKFRGEDFDVTRDDGMTDLDDVGEIEALYEKAYRNCVSVYNSLIGLGVPQEKARKVLPMGTKVNMTVSANARAWMHILHVRQKGNVQGETRRCAERIFEELRDEWAPYAFEKYDEMNFHGLNP